MSSLSIGSDHAAPHFQSFGNEARWYAAYTRANREKRIYDHLQGRMIESFLPVYEVVRCWTDRRVKLQLPLFPGYLFVRIPIAERLRVLQVPGVVRLVGFNTIPSPLQDKEIETLRTALTREVRARPHPFLTVGRRVHVKCGPFSGLEGIVIRKKNRLRLVISVHLIFQSAAVEIEETDLEPI